MPLRQQFTLQRGQLAVVQGEGLRVQFVGVTADSRCPGDAVCILGGDAQVHVRAFGAGGASTEYQLHTGDTSKAAVTHDGYRIALIDLQPYPFSSLPPIDPDDYRATLAVTR